MRLFSIPLPWHDFKNKTFISEKLDYSTDNTDSTMNPWFPEQSDRDPLFLIILTQGSSISHNQPVM